MSRDGSVTLDWGDGTYHFRLGWGELAKIQEACDAGPFVVLQRLRDRTCRTEDISAVMLWALVGGGKTPVEATKLVRCFVEDRPPAESRLVACAVMLAGCLGAPEEQIEKIRGSESGQRLADLPNGKFRFGAIYALGAKLQMTPQQVNGMSIWQFYALVSGATEESGALSGEEADEIWEWIKGA